MPPVFMARQAAGKQDGMRELVERHVPADRRFPACRSNKGPFRPPWLGKQATCFAAHDANKQALPCVRFQGEPRRPIGGQVSHAPRRIAVNFAMLPKELRKA